MKNNFLTIVLVLFFSLFTSLAQSEAYQYFPNSPLYLGGTFDPRKMANPHLPCIEYDGKVQLISWDPDKQVGVETKFTLNELKSHRDLYNYLHVSASVSGHYKFFSGSGSYELERESFLDSDSFSWIISGYTNFGQFGMSNPRLTSEAADLVGDADAFRVRCGTDFVGQETRSVLIAAIFTINNFQETKREKVEASLKAAVKVGIGGIEGDTKYSSFYKEAISSGTISFRLYAIGGKGITDLSDIPLNTDDVTKIKQIISDYTKNLTIQHSVPTEFLTNSLDAFYPRLATFDFAQYNKFIESAYFQVLEYEKKRERLLSILNNTEDYDLSKISEENLRDNFDLLMDYIQKINNRVRECRELHLGKLSTLASDSIKKNMIAKTCTLDSTLIATQKIKFPPSSPFTWHYWTDELTNAPQIFMYIDVKGKHLSEVKILSSNKDDVLKVIKIDSSELLKSALGAIEYSAIADQDKPLQLQITMESGTSYLRELKYDNLAPVSVQMEEHSNKVQILERGQLFDVIPLNK